MGKAAALLRPATPDPGEGLLFARYMDQAAEGFFGFMLGRNAERIIACAFCEPGHSLSFEHVVFAERVGVVAGMVSAFTGAQHRSFSERHRSRGSITPDNPLWLDFISRNFSTIQNKINVAVARNEIRIVDN